MNIKKILVLTAIFPPAHGGSGKFIFELYNRFKKNSYYFLTDTIEDQTLAATEVAISQNKIIKRVNFKTKSWSVMTFNGLCFYLKMWFKIICLTKKTKSNEIHCSRVVPEGLLALFVSKFISVDIVCFIHGEDIEIAKNSREYRWLIDKLFRKSKLLICNSLNTHDLLKKNWNTYKNKIAVITPGVDVDYYCPSMNVKKLRGELKIDEFFTILTVSRLQERKGHDTLIKSISNLVKKMDNLLYLIIGTGSEQPRLMRLVDKLNLSYNVKFLGSLNDEDTLKYYQAANLFVLPNRTVNSDVEGFGMVLLESQACGVPIITGNSGGTKETLAAGETGLVIDCENCEELTKTLESVINDKNVLEKMAGNTRGYILDNHRWENSVRKASAVLEEVSLF
jgi:phosphatidylinositol alpha-1,6-mannosyltransferase